MSSEARGAEPYIPKGGTLRTLSAAVQECRGCDLYRHATQAVFGEGRPKAHILMVGEQPGDKEDVAGKPFVGPAGTILNKALQESDIDRDDVYVTNAVKHFKFEERGKRRLHKKPSSSEILACRPWLEAELTLVRPRIVVCLGATAVQAVLGKQYQVLRDRGKFFPYDGAEAVTITIHPSAILRAQTPEERHKSYQAFVRDLTAVRQKLAGLAGAA